MTQGLQEVTAADLATELEKILSAEFVQQLRMKAPGHCMRVGDLDSSLMQSVCARLKSEVPGSQVFVLGGNGQAEVSSGLFVSSSKLVELRNPASDGSLRPPLLVFVPNELRTSSEDSFGVATFEDVSVRNVYEKLIEALQEELPSDLKLPIREILGKIKDREWRWANPLAIARFLLTVKLTGFDPDAIGGALFELGLVPDFGLMQSVAAVMRRIGQNLDAVDGLTNSGKTERGRVIDLKLTSAGFVADFGRFLEETGLESPRNWTRRIVLDRSNWRFSFDKWPLEEGHQEPEEICITVVSTSLPTIKDDEQDPRLQRLIGQQVLTIGPQGVRKFSATFRTNPAPSRVAGLAKFKVEIVAVDGGPAGLVRTKSVWQGARLEATVSFDRLQGADWEEGWHFVRVQAYTADDDPITLLDENGQRVSSLEESEARKPNESELFYVVADEDVDVAPTQRAVPIHPSLMHAWFDKQFSAVSNDRDPNTIRCTGIAWTQKRSRGEGRGTDLLEVKFGAEGTVHVPISRQLKLVEQNILKDPEGAVSWRISVSMGSANPPTPEAFEWPNLPATEAFITARRLYCDAVRQCDRMMVSQGSDLKALQPLAAEYAQTYGLLLGHLMQAAERAAGADQQRLLDAIRRLLGLDSVLVVITDYKGERRQAALLGPTHPLRALWFAAWSEIGKRWLEGARRDPKEFAGPTKQTLLEVLCPANTPPLLPAQHGALFSAVDNVHPFWTLYAPANEEDPRGLVGEVCSALGLPEPNIGGNVVTGEYLAARVRRYLVQHPYVRTLTINAFNPGRGRVLADMLLELQRERAFADLQYDLRLFVPDPEASGAGEAIEELLSPSGSITAKEADAFSTPGHSHLYPKLSFSVRATDDFRRMARDYPAHVSMLFDVFPAEEVGADAAFQKLDTIAVHGLMQGYRVRYCDDETLVAWKRQPRHGVAKAIHDAEVLTDLLSQLPEMMSAASAIVATGQAGMALRPVITLSLDTDDRALIHQVHDVSDWVFTIDRNMGIEFFDHGGRADRPDYLIDHSPDMASNLGHKVVITSRSLEEIEWMFRTALDQYHLPADAPHAVMVLDHLRSLSGRLALKLLSSPSQRGEALGLALARMFLKQQDIYLDQIVVPLDAHLDLYRVLEKTGDPLGDEISLKRTDLALFDLNANARTITCNLIEVKCFTQVGSFGMYNQLKDRIAEQIVRSEQVLQHHFDPNRTETDRPDRLLKTQELATLLEFYLDRAVRLGLMRQEVEAEARFLISTLEDGYRLVFTRSALIFDLDKPGTELPEVEAGVEYHRIGIDVVRQLMEMMAPAQVPVGEPLTTVASEATPAEPTPEKDVTPAKEPTIPRLPRAAFLVHDRDRTVSWEVLQKGRLFADELGSGVESILKRPIEPQCSKPATPNPVPDPPVLPDDGSAPGQLKTAPRVPIVQPADRRPSLAVEKSGSSQTPSITPPSERPPEIQSSVIGERKTAVDYDILLGVTSKSPQYGLLGTVSARKIALDLNQTHTIALFGVQGGGKSYTLGTIAEMASMPIPSINVLPQPLATVIFHYSPTQDYKPEFTSMVAPNSDQPQVEALAEQYGCTPKALHDVILLTPVDKVQLRREEYPNIEVFPLKFAASELQASHWRFLMGAVGNQATYIRQLNMVMRELRNDLTMDALRHGVEASAMPDQMKELARMRLNLAAQYIDDAFSLSSIIRPGRLIIVDLRDEFIEKDEALGLFVVLLQIFADAKYQGQSFNKLIVFDECHKFIDSPDLVAGLVEVVREMRHKGTSIMVASQDPPSVPVSLIELSSQIILHKFNSPAWLKHIQKANAALANLTADKMASLGPGEAYVWSSKATDEAFSKGAVRIRCRPRVTAHGGATRTAV